MRDETTDDEKQFGSDRFVYCKSHMRPHKTGWCTVDVEDKVPLDASDYASACTEARNKGFKIYGVGEP